MQGQYRDIASDFYSAQGNLSVSRRFETGLGSHYLMHRKRTVETPRATPLAVPASGVMSFNQRCRRLSSAFCDSCPVLRIHLVRHVRHVHHSPSSRAAAVEEHGKGLVGSGAKRCPCRRPSASTALGSTQHRPYSRQRAGDHHPSKLTGTPPGNSMQMSPDVDVAGCCAGAATLATRTSAIAAHAVLCFRCSFKFTVASIRLA